MAYKHNQKAPDDQVLDLLLTEGGWLQRASFGWLPAAYMRNPPSYYRGVDCVIDHDHGNPPGLLKHSEVKPVLPPVSEIEVVEFDEDEPIRCLSLDPAKSDLWCSQNCQLATTTTSDAMRAAMCPANMCVCDWEGTWPDDDAKGFANWDLASLGIDETKDKNGMVPEIAMGPSAPPVSPGEVFVQPKSMGAPSPPPIVCPKPGDWCGYPGATNEPSYCGEDNVPGHFCHDVLGKSGFSPCDKKEDDNEEDDKDGEDEREADFQRRKAVSDRETLDRSTPTMAGAQSSPAPGYMPTLPRAQSNAEIVDGFDIIDPLYQSVAAAAAKRGYVAAAETKAAAAAAYVLASPPAPSAVGCPFFGRKRGASMGRWAPARSRLPLHFTRLGLATPLHCVACERPCAT